MKSHRREIFFIWIPFLYRKFFNFLIFALKIGSRAEWGAKILEVTNGRNNHKGPVYLFTGKNKNIY